MQRQQQPQQLAPQIDSGGHREQDPNSLVEKFIKRGAKEFHGNEDLLDAVERLIQIENIFNVFLCTGDKKSLSLLICFEV